MNEPISNFWSVPPERLFASLDTTVGGLSDEEARRRIRQYGPNSLKPQKRLSSLVLFLEQFKSPLIIILIFAALLSYFLSDTTDAVIIMSIILASGILGFWQEKGASDAVKKLLAMIQIKASVLRDGRKQEIPIEDIVPGDVVTLKAGDVIPGDCRIFESKDLFVNEATLTGETFPVEKEEKIIAADASLSERVNSLWMGTNAVSGTATALVARTGARTEFGKVSERLRARPQETDFQRGIRKFGYFLMQVTLILVIAIFAVNSLYSCSVRGEHHILDAFMFSLALAVGLTPQLLPAIISINLAHGAKLMAAKKVIVKRLASIENFGSMDVLCSDKTGTLTEGTVRLEAALGPEGAPSETAFLCAYLNAFYQSGFVNPIDEAVIKYKQADVSAYRKRDEVPYDFIRKRLSVLVSRGDEYSMITKGALGAVLSVCSRARLESGESADISGLKDKIQRLFEQASANGCRTMGVAYKPMAAGSSIRKEDERDMIFAGFLILSDSPKRNIAETIKRLAQMGITLKIITGDNRLVAANIAGQIGIVDAKILTGPDLRAVSTEALTSMVSGINIFAEVEPNQKESIILALRRAGNVVGYIGDGINDASALHAADVGISVDSAVDVAKEAADIVLLEKDLSVVVDGVREGRKTFANTLKYIFMATSANFGNMFSMAGASLFLSFLPLLPKQILLTNLMTDFPEMAIATDNVDAELVEKPRRWNIAFIRKFMITFGILSSVFDYLTFGVLLFMLRANPAQFRSGWFMESVISAVLIVLVVRTRKPFFKSFPGKYLVIATVFIIAAVLILPYTPFAAPFEIVRLPSSFIGIMFGIIALYVISAEIAKSIFYKKVKL